jgi:GntR family transcriptional regulator, arabinose operon transcriptional repressor
VEAVVCANDITAANIMRALDLLDIKTPQSVRIVGVDDVKYASLLRVPLTTLHQPCQHIGAAAVRALTERIANPDLPVRDILFQSRLVVRESCGARLNGAKSPRPRL